MVSFLNPPEVSNDFAQTCWIKASLRTLRRITEKERYEMDIEYMYINIYVQQRRDMYDYDI